MHKVGILIAVTLLLTIVLWLLLRTETDVVETVAGPRLEITSERRALPPRPRPTAADPEPEEVPVEVEEDEPPARRWAPQARSQAPPGTVFLEGRETIVGLAPEAAREAILATHKVSIWGETPEHRVLVDDLYLMTTEVTNEQYAEFVRATSARPPLAWAARAVNGAQRRFIERQEQSIVAARDAGLPPPERVKFDRQWWWKHNWRELSWEVPEGRERHPVTEVDHDQARAYAAWAGMRLPTEQEYQRAVRGGERRLYPWGEEFDATRAVTLESELRALQPVASDPLGLRSATPDGIHDLAGNAWEWTASPYLPFPGYAPERLEVHEPGGVRTLQLDCDWDEEVVVSVGGCFANEWTAARATTRRPTARSSSTTAVGFRCAAGKTAGAELLRHDLVEEITTYPLPYADDLLLDFEACIADERWRAHTPADAPPGYAIVTDYTVVAFAPVADPEHERRRASMLTSGRRIGVLLTSTATDRRGILPTIYALEWREEESLLDLRSPDGYVSRTLPVEPSTLTPGPPSIELTAVGETELHSFAWTDFEVHLRLPIGVGDPPICLSLELSASLSRPRKPR